MERDLPDNGRFGLVRLEQRMRDHERRLTKIEDGYVSHRQFGPVSKLVYGLAVAMLLAVIGALMKVVIVS